MMVTVLGAQEPATEDTKQRVKAARSYAKAGSAGVERLKPYLTDSDASVRRAAVDSLVAIGGQLTLEPLTAALADGDGEVQKIAATGIVNFYVPGYYKGGWTGKFKPLLGSEDIVVPDYVSARPEIVAALGKVTAESPSMEARAAAARALGVLRGRAACDQLLAALLTKNSEVMYEALTALEKIGNTDVAPKIFYMLRDPDEKVQLAAIQAVSVLGNKDANAPLREAWERTKSDKVRRAALEAIAMLPDEANRPVFDQYLSDSDEGMRAGAAEGLGRLGKAEDLPRIQAVWESERKTRPRLSQAYAMVAMGQREISELSPLQYLINTLNSKAWQGVARGYLKALAPEPAVRHPLHHAALNGTRAEKMALADILSAGGGKDSLEPLEALSKDPDPAVSTESMRALRTLRMRLQ